MTHDRQEVDRLTSCYHKIEFQIPRFYSFPADKHLSTGVPWFVFLCLCFSFVKLLPRGSFYYLLSAKWVQLTFPFLAEALKNFVQGQLCSVDTQLTLSTVLWLDFWPAIFDTWRKVLGKKSRTGCPYCPLPNSFCALPNAPHNHTTSQCIY